MIHFRRKPHHQDGRDLPLRRANSDVKEHPRAKGIATVWNGWLLTILCIIGLFYLALPRLQQGMPVSAVATDDKGKSVVAVKDEAGAGAGAGAASKSDVETEKHESPSEASVQEAEQHKDSEAAKGDDGATPGPDVPDCPSAPWKPDEDLVGTCPGIRVKDKSINSAADCAKTCCNDADCVVWQFRRDKGCLQGGDVRIGQEKDGPAAYCSDHPPFQWKGQLIKDRRDTECSTATWHPDEQPGQCFGLGDKRKNVENTVEACMMACCQDETCGAWQFQEELGCFYNKHMHSCQKSNDPNVFQPYVGRRKLLSTRKYTDKKGKPANNWKKTSK